MLMTLSTVLWRRVESKVYKYGQTAVLIPQNRNDSSTMKQLTLTVQTPPQLRLQRRQLRQWLPINMYAGLGCNHSKCRVILSLLIA
jgi:hypothetical protein